MNDNETSDRRSVIYTLAGLATAALAGIIVLAVIEQSIPDVLQNVVTLAVGALAGILAPSPVRRK